MFSLNLVNQFLQFCVSLIKTSLYLALSLTHYNKKMEDLHETNILDVTIVSIFLFYISWSAFDHPVFG